MSLALFAAISWMFKFLFFSSSRNCWENLNYRSFEISIALMRKWVHLGLSGEEEKIICRFHWCRED